MKEKMTPVDLRNYLRLTKHEYYYLRNNNIIPSPKSGLMRRKYYGKNEVEEILKKLQKMDESFNLIN